MTDTERINWLEQRARKSYTGISFDWIPSVDDEPSGFRFMRRHFIGDPAKTLRDAIDRAADGAEKQEKEEKGYGKKRTDY